MTKIMVVEDDQSLREIYSIRLTAEGYEIVSAGDGEEALALAVKERPDLIPDVLFKLWDPYWGTAWMEAMMMPAAVLALSSSTGPIATSRM